MFVSGPVFLFQKVENQHMTVPAGIVSQNLERMKIKPENGGIAMKTWSKRIGLILFFSLWAAAGLQIWAKKQEGKEKEATAVFAKLSLEDQNGIVQYYGKLKTEKQVQMLERREEYLRNLARQLGISSHIVISRTYGEDSQTTILQKEGANADTELRLVTWREKGEITGQSLYGSVTIYGGNFEEAFALRQQLKNVLDAEMEKKRSSVAVEGIYAGAVAIPKREQIAQVLLQGMDAKVASSNQAENLYTVYAYSPYFPESVRQGKKRINLSLTMYYDSRKQQTKVRAAVPVSGVAGEST